MSHTQAVVYWVLVLPLWLAGLTLMALLFLVGLGFRRWPIAVGGSLIGAGLAVTTFAVWVAALATWELIAQHRVTLLAASWSGWAAAG